MLIVLAFVATPVLLAPLAHSRAPVWLANALVFVPLAAAAYFLSRANAVRTGDFPAQSVEWVPSLDIALAVRLDGLSWVFAVLITVIGTAVVLYAGSYLKGDAQLGRFFAILFLFMASMLGIVLADDIIVLFVAWELTSITSYLLVGFKHEDEGARKAALQALLVTGGGGLALLAGLILLADVAGSTSISTILASGDVVRDSDRYPAILALVCLGAFTKSAQVPFHFWLPSAMVAPTPVSAYLHSATMVKAGVYLLARFHPVLGDTDAWTAVLGTAGILTALTGAYLAIQSYDLKRVFAYSTVSMLGMLVFLIGLGSEVAIIGAMVLLVAHAGYKAVLFLVAGAIDHEAGTRDIRELAGVAGKMPIIAAAGAVGLVGLAGLPPLLAFIGKEEALIAAGETGQPTLLLALLVATKALAVAVVLIVAHRLARAAPSNTAGKAHDPPWQMWLPPWALAVFSLAGGVWLAGATRWFIVPASAAVLGEPVKVKLSYWHGFSTELWLTGAGVAIGAVIAAAWLIRGPLLAWPARAAEKVGPSAGYDRGLAGLLAIAGLQTRFVDAGRLRYSAGTIVVVWLTLVAVALVRAGTMPTLAGADDVGLYELLAVGLIVTGAIGAVFSRSQLGAVAFLGAIGYGVALVYILFGAPDLAMTQFLVETLTVLLFVLVFYRLPRFSRLSSTVTRWRDATIAAAAGIIACSLVLLVQNAEHEEPISGYFAVESVPSAFGRNIVNVILVDFRALDTLGEISVIAIAALGIFALLRIRSAKGNSQ